MVEAISYFGDAIVTPMMWGNVKVLLLLRQQPAQAALSREELFPFGCIVAAKRYSYASRST